MSSSIAVVSCLVGFLSTMSVATADRNFKSSLKAAESRTPAAALDVQDWPQDWPYSELDLSREDESDDSRFYSVPRFVMHIDDDAINALRGHYSATFSGNEAVLDICSSWTSHYPDDFKGVRVAGLGMNEAELAKNPSLTESVVHNLNSDPTLPYANESFDFVTNAVSVDYLSRPKEVFREIIRVLKPGGKAIMSFSNRCFPTKVVKMWHQTNDAGHIWVVGSYFHYAGFNEIRGLDISPNPGRSDPMFVIEGRKPAVAAKEL